MKRWAALVALAVGLSSCSMLSRTQPAPTGTSVAPASSAAPSPTPSPTPTPTTPTVAGPFAVSFPKGAIVRSAATNGGTGWVGFTSASADEGGWGYVLGVETATGKVTFDESVGGLPEGAAAVKDKLWMAFGPADIAGAAAPNTVVMYNQAARAEQTYASAGPLALAAGGNGGVWVLSQPAAKQLAVTRYAEGAAPGAAIGLPEGTMPAGTAALAACPDDRVYVATVDPAKPGSAAVTQVKDGKATVVAHVPSAASLSVACRAEGATALIVDGEGKAGLADIPAGAGEPGNYRPLAPATGGRLLSGAVTWLLTTGEPSGPATVALLTTAGLGEKVAVPAPVLTAAADGKTLFLVLAGEGAGNYKVMTVTAP